MGIVIMTQPNIHKSEDKEKLVIEITEDNEEWVEKIGRAVYNKCNELDRNRIKLNEQHTGFIIESNDAAVLGYIGWAIEQYLVSMPSKLKPTFQKILDDVKVRKEKLERS
jgi:hypothetical protein